MPIVGPSDASPRGCQLLELGPRGRKFVNDVLVGAKRLADAVGRQVAALAARLLDRLCDEKLLEGLARRWWRNEVEILRRSSAAALDDAGDLVGRHFETLVKLVAFHDAARRAVRPER